MFSKPTSPSFQLKPVRKGIQTAQHRSDSCLCPPAGVSPDTFLPPPALGTAPLCDGSSSHCPSQQNTYTSLQVHRRKLPWKKAAMGERLRCLTPVQAGYLIRIKIPLPGTQSRGAEVQGDALGRAEGLSLALGTMGALGTTLPQPQLNPSLQLCADEM